MDETAFYFLRYITKYLFFYITFFLVEISLIDVLQADTKLAFLNCLVQKFHLYLLYFLRCRIFPFLTPPKSLVPPGV